MKVLSKLRAVTLVSLLIGMSLGAFLIVTMLQIFSTTQANYKLAQNLAELNDVVRYASVVMTEVVGQAGYRIPHSTTGLPAYNTAFPAFTGSLTGPTGFVYTTSGFPNSSDVAGLPISYFPGETVIISAGAADKLWVKFYGDNNGYIRDCNDLYGSETTPIKIRFYSRDVTVGGNTETAYYCEKHLNATNYTYSASTPVGTELIPAELFDTAWVRYGEDITGTGYIDRWIEGDDVADRNKVFAVRVAFLVHTRDNVRSADVTQTFNVFGTTVTRTSKKIYKLAMFTILLPYAQNYTLSNGVVTP